MLKRARSLFIVFEGIDGAGKSTQVRLLKEALERAGEQPVVSREPTDGPWGRMLRESAATGRMSLEEELHAFIEDRKEHVAGVLRPALEAGKIVILDRYFYSTIAYQGARGADVAEVRARMVAQFPIPDAVFILDAEPQVGVHRIAHSRGRPDLFEDREYLERVRTIFKSMTGPGVHHIDASMPVEAVHARIMELLPQRVLAG
ncbi:MAG TPA: dTMP kinase [Bryobacteraceae bacterium]|nr:dTMP kinase [Bryobacteraceae bacterium]